MRKAMDMAGRASLLVLAVVACPLIVVYVTWQLLCGYFMDLGTQEGGDDEKDDSEGA